MVFVFNTKIKIEANQSIYQQEDVRSIFQAYTFFAQRGDPSSCLLLTSF